MFSITPVFASENDNNEIYSETVVLQNDSQDYVFGSDLGTIGLRGTSAPGWTSVWNLGTDGTYTLSGASSYHDLYSNYNFRGTNNMVVVVTPTKVGNVTVKLYTKIALASDQLLETWTVPLGSTVYKFFNNLSTTGYYYLKFTAPCYFTGSVYSQ